MKKELNRYMEQEGLEMRKMIDAGGIFSERRMRSFSEKLFPIQNF